MVCAGMTRRFKLNGPSPKQSCASATWPFQISPNERPAHRRTTHRLRARWLRGVAGILLNSIAQLLISEVIIRENLRVKRRLPMSNQDISYSVKSITVNRPNMQNESTSLIKKISRILIRPSGGDDIAIFYVPFSVLLFLFIK